MRDQYSQSPIRYLQLHTIRFVKYIHAHSRNCEYLQRSYTLPLFWLMTTSKHNGMMKHLL